MSDDTGGMPKVVWFLWFQGLHNAPYVVRKCHESWVARNPGWRVVTLDESTLSAYGSLDYSSGNIARLRPAHRSDLLRLDLLTHHGGVWADASCFCVQPLDDWLIPNAGSGFFAFNRPGPDRIISNWFLAAEPGNVLVSRLFSLMLGYWSDHSFRGEQWRFLVAPLTRLLRRSPWTRAWWFSRPLRDWLALYPYYVFHYGFEKLVRDDPDCARVWGDTPKISADPPHHLYRAGLLPQASAALRAEIDRREVPVYKMTWRIRDEAIAADSALGYLLDTAARQPQ